MHSTTEASDRSALLRTWSIVLGAIAANYGVAHYVLPGRVDGALLAYGIRPGLWVLVGVTAFVVARREGIVLAEWHRTLLVVATVAGVVHVAVMFLAGMRWGLGASPYLMTLAGMAGNALHVFVSLLGMEVARACLVRAAGPRRLLTALVGSSVVLTLAQLPPAAYSRLATPESAVTFGGIRLLPDLSESMFASLLALLGGAPASLAYRGVLAAAHWLSPILPDLPWAPAAFLGTTIPVLMLVLVANAHRDRLSTGETPASEPASHGSRGGIGLAAIGLLAVLLFWFIAGLFGPRPVLIASRSMEPAIKLGDVAIVTPVDTNEVSVDDVIAFQQANMHVPFVHRVIEVRSEQDGLTFVTKGDANSRPDRDPVREDHIEGKVETVVPKIGWLAIGVKNAVAALSLK